MSYLVTARAGSNRVMKFVDTTGHEKNLFGSDIHSVKSKKEGRIM